MDRKRIIILGTVLGLALIGLIVIQTKYLQTAFKLRKAQFDFSVNRTFSGIIANLEEKVKDDKSLKSLPKSSGHTVDTGTKRIIDLMDYDEAVTASDLKPFKANENADLKQSIARYRQSRKKLVASGFSPSENTSQEISVEELLKGIDLQKIVRKNLRYNAISDNFEYAVKEHDRFIIMSSGFFNGQSDFQYSKHFSFGNDLVNATFYLFFPDKTHSTTESLKLLLPNAMITLILICCFVFCIMMIIRQKKLSEIKNDFINNMTHEFKTPIATISLAAQMLKEPDVQQIPKSVDHIAGIVHDESNRLTFQVEKVLQTALFTESRMKLKLKNLHVNELIEGQINKFRLRLDNQNGEITSHLEAKNDEIYADEVHITNIISNLIDNALKYCKRNPEIAIYTRNRGDEIIISVVDNGIGIAPKDQKLIFERFYRVSTGNLHDVKGFGLGLSYVKKIVEVHQGKIEVESTIDKGSRFDVILPLAGRKIKVKKTLFF
ncbi:MAG: HAMP domain-containing histidine kinase [Culturomica sp.]|jgi:two-component system phosphate regulon sensor histidine kinase PhoR|nr:HAMP domain-containing histidine kinase [Culturomica sp.]